MNKVMAIVILAAALIAAGLVLSKRKQPGGYSCFTVAYELYVQGEEHLQSFQYAQAEEKLTAAVRLEPGFAMASAALGEVYYRTGRRELWERNLAETDSVAATIPNERERLLVQLRLSNASDSRYAAVQDSLLATADQIAPDHIIVLIAKAFRAERTGDFAEQERLWERVVEVEPNFVNGYNMLGYLALYQGHYDEAIADIQKYAYLAPGMHNPHDSLGEMLMTVGRYEEAEQEFRRALAIQPDFHYSLINLAKVYIARGQLTKGVRILEEVRKQIAGTELEKRIDYDLINTYFTNHLLPQLDEATARYIALYPDDSRAGIYRTMRLAFRGRTGEAYAVLDSTMAALREDPIYENHVGYRKAVDVTDERIAAFMAEERGDYTVAAANWAKVLAALADYAPHRLFYEHERSAAVLIELGQYEDALDQLETILRVNPRLLRPLGLAAQAHLGLGQTREARKYLDQLEKALIKADPDYPCRVKVDRLRNEFTAP